LTPPTLSETRFFANNDFLHRECLSQRRPPCEVKFKIASRIGSAYNLTAPNGGYMGIRVYLAALLVMAHLPLAAQTKPASAPKANTVQTPAQTLLGQGWGVDHVGVGVRDLAQAQHDYQGLGFKISKGGHFPGGLSNCIVRFQNNSYLELLSVTGTKPGDAADIAEFVKKHEGAMFLGINVSSAKAAADYLKTHNFDAADPEPGSIMSEGETKSPPPQWYTVGTADKPAASKEGFTIPIFFIEYLSKDRVEKSRAAGWMDHPNTAMSIHSVWFAVHDMEKQLRTLRDAGLEIGESREVKFLGAHGRKVKAGQGELVMLDSGDKKGLLTEYLTDHDEGVIALSIEVSDLGKARRLAESSTGSTLDTYNGFYGPSFLLSPKVTHGVWIEMFQTVDHLH
jgi:catechol 2,3-dioxygenase-like lactoylglutathione lyase family enzyme